MTHSWEQTISLLPILAHIQANLDNDLSLQSVAQVAQLSHFHFHRQFQTAVGETLKQYTQRLRLERAAYQLKIRDASVLEIALACGFQTHETFSRAFKRHFALTPLAFRQQQNAALLPSSSHAQTLNHHTSHFQLSHTQVQKLNPLPVAFIRHLGPYTEVDTSSFDRLITWAKETGQYDGSHLLLAIGHDDPAITPPDKLRFDACLEVKRPFSPTHDIGYQTTPAGLYSLTSYIGPYGPTMFQAYHAIFTQLTQLKRYQIIGLPVLEIYRTTQINPHYALNHTDILIPLQEK